MEPHTRGTPQYEVKFDGWRCLAFTAGPIHLQSRHGKDLTRHFPDVRAGLDAALLPDAVLDGELIVFDPARGRTSFGALQDRVRTGRRPLAVSYVVFDLLQLDGIELLDRPLLERRMLLEELLDGVPVPVLCPATRDPDEARRWFDDYAVTGAEGIMIKDLSSRYRPTGPGWWKWKRRTTTEAIIAGVQGVPETLLLGRRSPSGRLHYVGRTVPLSAGQAAALRPRLTPAGPDHPWPRPLPRSWSGGFDQAPADYVPVLPDLIAEIAADAAHDHGRWRHPVRFLRLRDDLGPAHLPLWTPEPAAQRPAS
ncbi:ATP-dependent DNA ligase [Actinoplanes sp. NPDC023714]|uniref:ATP-dependent DNA ligase n=1 Tax=Actinoplanes sp. NPDC023714 TaxID=3154322 RepID=UPI0033CD5F70